MARQFTRNIERIQGLVLLRPIPITLEERENHFFARSEVLDSMNEVRGTFESEAIEKMGLQIKGTYDLLRANSENLNSKNNQLYKSLQQYIETIIKLD